MVRTGRFDPEQAASLTELLIAPALQRALDERNYTELTPVQAAVVAPDAMGRDLLVSAQTGSGKTVAYGLGISSTLLGDDERMGVAGAPLALIVAPTRELALQVQRELAWLYAQAGTRIISCVGGMDPAKERKQLGDGCHIVVGTPGRLRDHIERNRLDLSQIKAVVLDEADEMLDLGFRDDLEFILEATPAGKRTLLFSATLPRGIAALAKSYQNNALRIEASSKDIGHADIDYRAIRVAPKEVELVVVNVLRLVDAPASLVFCNTRDAVRHLQAMLVERGFAAVYLSGELGQNERNQALQALRDGRARVCVATDVAARGIDLPNLGLVIHADLPHDAEILQHRSGRTGRAGRKGVSVVIVPPARRRKAEGLLAEAGIEPRWTLPPTAEDIRVLDRQRMIEDPALREEPGEEDLAMARMLIAERTPEEIAAMLARMYRSRLPEPEEVSDPSSWFDKAVRARHGADRARPERGFERGQERGHDRGFERAASEPGSARPGPRERGMRNVATGSGDMVLFRVEIGRRNKADPKWLLPMLCRRGKVTRDDIGTIRIQELFTEVEISGEAAENFAVNVRRTDGDDIRINPISANDRGGAAERPRFEKPRFDKPKFDKPRFDKPKFDKPRFDKPASGGPDADAARPDRAHREEDRAPHAQARPYAGAKKRFDADRAGPRDNAPRSDERPAREGAFEPRRGVKPYERKGLPDRQGASADPQGREGYAKEGYGKKPFAKKPFSKPPFGKGPDKGPGKGPAKGAGKGGAGFRSRKPGG
jgi:ATP-dependent RNA helicase DeaD